MLRTIASSPWSLMSLTYRPVTLHGSLMAIPGTLDETLVTKPHEEVFEFASGLLAVDLELVHELFDDPVSVLLLREQFPDSNARFVELEDAVRGQVDQDACTIKTPGDDVRARPEREILSAESVVCAGHDECGDAGRAYGPTPDLSRNQHASRCASADDTL